MPSLFDDFDPIEKFPLPRSEHSEHWHAFYNQAWKKCPVYKIMVTGCSRIFDCGRCSAGGC